MERGGLGAKVVREAKARGVYAARKRAPKGCMRDAFDMASVGGGGDPNMPLPAPCALSYSKYYLVFVKVQGVVLI